MSDSQIIERYLGGETRDSIAKSLNMCTKTLSSLLARHDIPLRTASEVGYTAQAKRKHGTDHIAGYFWCRWRAGAIARDIPFDLTNQDLEDQYMAQKGLCYYTGLSLITTPFTVKVKDLAHSPYLISLDRKEREGSYTRDNVVLCCVAVNFGKHRWGEKTFQDIVQSIRTHRPTL